MENSRPTIIFDGTCGVCARSVDSLKKMDRKDLFEVLPYQAPEFATRFPKISEDQAAQAMFLCLPDGRAFHGADAFREVFLRMPRTWLLGAFMSIPPVPWIARRVYALFARNRHRFGSQECKWPR